MTKYTIGSLWNNPLFDPNEIMPAHQFREVVLKIFFKISNRVTFRMKPDFKTVCTET